jgi:hypothetical protein
LVSSWIAVVLTIHDHRFNTIADVKGVPVVTAAGKALFVTGAGSQRLATD